MTGVLYWGSWAFLAALLASVAWLGYLARTADHD
jgi:hypothetical protein